MSFSIISNDAIDTAAWDAFVISADRASLYHLHGWKEVIERTFGHRTFYLAAVDVTGRIYGILPLAQLKSALFGNMLVSLPFFNYGGISAVSDEARAALLKAAVAVATSERVDFIEIRHDAKVALDLPVKTTKVAMRLQLPGDADELWQGFGTRLRNRVLRPKKKGMQTAVGREELLDAFYDVFAANMRDLGTPVYGKPFFRNILRRFPDQTWICTVHFEDTPVAAGFLAGFRDSLEIPWASSLRAANKFGPNMLMYWTCLEFACARGYRVFDFGRSTVGEGTYTFKEQWGATPHQLYWHYYLPNGGPLPQVNPDNPKYRLAIALWQRLPLGLTRTIGPAIVKYIP